MTSLILAEVPDFSGVTPSPNPVNQGQYVPAPLPTMGIPVSGSQPSQRPIPVQLYERQPELYTRVYTDIANNAFGVVLGVSISIGGILWILHWLGIKDLVARLILFIQVSTRSNQKIIDNQLAMAKDLANIQTVVSSIDRKVDGLTHGSQNSQS